MLMMLNQHCFISWQNFRGKSQVLGMGLFLSALLACGCGHIGGVPGTFRPQEYTEVTLSQLRQPAEAEKLKGRLVKFSAFFWEFVHYDPAMLRNYGMLAGHPLSWWSLSWAALYETERMTGFYDRLAVDRQQKDRLKLRRLAPLTIYGEVAPMGSGLTYVRLHQVEERRSD